MTLIFDCESHHTALSSIARLYEVNVDNIIDFLTNFDLEQHIEPGIDPTNVTLIKSFELEIGNLKNLPASVYWFHCTRAKRTETFEEGILPLGKAIDKIWNIMFSIFSDTDHEKRLFRLQKEGVNNDLYQIKIPDAFHWGPYAHLVREVAFQNEEFWAHDYLRLPEIIEDICDAYQEKYSISIEEDVMKALTPCIIKFKSNKRTDSWVVYRAILYLYCKFRGIPFFVEANTSFDAKNEIIPRKDIVNIEFIDGNKLYPIK